MIKPMLLKTCKDKDLTKYEGDWIAQVKFDGTRIIAIKEGDNVTLQTRSGKSELSSEYPNIVKELVSIPKDFVIDGELVFFNNSEKEVFLTGRAKESRVGLIPRFIIFDIIECDGIDIRKWKLSSRQNVLEELLFHNHFYYINSSKSHSSGFNKFYDSIINEGREGIVLKRLDSIYEDGIRSKNWLKVKREETHDCFVVGLTTGEGKYSDSFGAVVLGQYNNSRIKVIGTCSGFDDETRKYIFNVVSRCEDFESFPVTKRRLYHYVKRVKPMLPMEIKCMEKHPNGHLRHPRFMRFRDDKSVEDCVFEPNI